MRNGSLFTDAKGRFAETIVSTLLEYAGYRVIRLGVEETVSEVKAVVARNEASLKLPDQLRRAPDFVVIDPNSGECTLLEVKFRRIFDNATAESLYEPLLAQSALWPGTVTAIVCADAQDRFADKGLRNFLGCLRTEDLGRLIETHDKLTRWQRLRTLGGVFARVLEKDGFYRDAENLVAPIRAWSSPPLPEAV
jgi:hypothetical protein